MKKTLLVIVFWGLLLVEVGLLEGFLPYSQRHAIHEQFQRVFPQQRYDPHPDMDWEFELAFRQNPKLRIAADAVLVILTLGNAYLIVRAWQGLRRIRQPTNFERLPQK